MNAEEARRLAAKSAARRPYTIEEVLETIRRVATQYGGTDARFDDLRMTAGVIQELESKGFAVRVTPLPVEVSWEATE